MQTDAQGQQEKSRILLVDDEPQVLTALEDLLGDDYIVYKSTSAHGALEMVAEQQDIAVVVTDQRMPKMSGDEMLSSLSKLSDAQSIMVTGFADMSAVIRAINDGKLFAYVTKPWNPQELLDKVDQAARQFRLTRQLTTERQLLHDLLENSPDGIFFKDREQRFVETNRAFWTMLGLKDRGQLLGKRLSDVLGESQLTRDIEAEEHAVLHQGSPALDTIRQYEFGSGESRWLAETRAPVRTPEHAVVGLVGITRDVSDRLAAQSALGESEELLRKQTGMLNSILEGLAEGVVVTDQLGNFLLVNREAQRILGADANALTIATWASVCELYDSENKTPLTATDNPLVRAIAGEDLIEVCVRSGETLRARIGVSATPLKDSHGAVVGGIGLLRDVTEQRDMAQRLAQSQKLDAVGRLAGGIAHDFNNLLSVIQSCGEMLLRNLAGSDNKRVEVGHILNAAQRAALLTRQLLSFSRQQVVQPRTLQVNDVVRQIEVMLRRVIGEHIEVVTHLDDRLGLVKMDASQLEQVIVNLALNARDAMPDGGRLSIETSNVDNRDGELATQPSGDFVRLTIRDSGMGMGAEIKRRMYEPFFTTKDVGKGSGLGLSTVYGIVEQNGGHILCQSAPQEGTEFEIYLNRTYASEPRHQAVAPLPTQIGPNGVGTILLVEDEDSVRRVAAAILRNHGYTVLEARRPSDALQICERGNLSIDLLLTDVVMPESSGPALAAELKARFPKMGVMYMSGYSGDNALMGKALRNGITFLQKPFTPALLAEAVDEAIPRTTH
jgi:two-component system cell cycle sensor histidine kinase/response regulator CckA